MHRWLGELAGWHEFYSFAGTAAATLMGLLFVVMSLGQRLLATDEGERATRAFFTPIVIFFGTVIVVAMFMLIPHASSGALGVLLGVIALAGLAFMIASGAHRAWRISELGVDDLFWYVVLPYLGFAVIGASGVCIWKDVAVGFYALAGAVVLMLVVGIRNLWDLVIYNIQHSGS